MSIINRSALTKRLVQTSLRQHPKGVELFTWVGKDVKFNSTGSARTDYLDQSGGAGENGAARVVAIDGEP